MNTRDADALLDKAERALVRARMALHAYEDAGRYNVACGDTDGDGDCPRCLTRTGFPEGEPQFWRCSEKARLLRYDTKQAMGDAALEAYFAADDLSVFLGTLSPIGER